MSNHDEMLAGLEADGFGHYFAGFVDGEGCFLIDHKGADPGFKCRFQVKLRDDDAPILAEFVRRTGLGRLGADTSATPTPGGKPRVVWRISSKRECAALVRVFERFPLRAKKLVDFLIWREAVSQWMQIKHGRNGQDWSGMAALRAQLQAARRYEDKAEIVPDPEVPQLRLIA